MLQDRDFPELGEVWFIVIILFVQLEGIYRLWKNEEGFTIDMVESWRQRVHQMLQDQADHMEGAFDNDYAVCYLFVTILCFLREIKLISYQITKSSRALGLCSEYIKLELNLKSTSFVNVSVQASW